MNPVELLMRVREVAAKTPLDLRALVALFEEADGLLETEVAAAWLLRHVSHAPIFEWLRHVDPDERLAAMRFVGQLGSPGARFLRLAVRDGVPLNARRARAAVGALRLADVAPPDRARRSLGLEKEGLGAGGWNVGGWFAGLSPPRQPRRRGWVGKVALPAAARTPEALLAALGLTAAEVRVFGRPVGGPGSGYVEFQIPKRRGMRTIAAPKQRLKTAQRWLLDNVFSSLTPHEAAHGFRRGRSVVTNARPHVGRGLVLKLDLQDFFPTIHLRRVEGMLLGCGYSGDVAWLLSRLATYRSRLPDGRAAQPAVLPQGAPTSPVLANVITRRLDARLAGLAAKFGANYTRYADDLTFSFVEPHPPKLGRFLWWVNAICQQEGFFENASKRRFLRRGGRQEVTGLVVNAGVSVPRHVRRRFRAALHGVRTRGLAAEARKYGREPRAYAAWLHGTAAWLAMVHPAQGQQWLAEVRQLLREGR